MDFGMLPPEINSARMYSGPGPGSILAAASAWDGLAAELGSTAVSYSSAVSGLTGGSWQGPSSASMAAAAAPFAAWLHSTAAQAEQTANQARAAVAAYETAFAMTVPPPLIAANRAQLMSLIATNVLGQNAPAIAATEAHYGEMWAQDAAAMYGYAGSSAAASAVTPFSPPPPTTNPAGLAAQAAATTQAAGTSAGTQAETVMSTAPQLMSTVPTALQGLTSPSSSASSTSALSSLSKLSSLATPLRFAMYPMNFLARGLSLAKTTGAPATAAAAGVKAAGSGLAGGVGSSTGALGSAAGLGAGGPAVSAGMGRAVSLGAMSVPQSWSTAGAAGAIAPAAAALPGAAPVGGSTGVPPLMPFASLAGRAAGGATPHYDLRPTVIPRSPSAG